jgi:AcrR family transcriptional regulator
LDAAEQLFSERGYEAATMGEIAARAGVSRGTPAYFFRSKEGLYRAVLGRAFAETVELVRSTDFEVGFEKAVAQSVGRYLDFLTARPGFVRLVVRECLDGGRFLQGLPEHLAALAQGMRAIGDGSESFRSEVDQRHFLLSAISMCWFPMVARPLTADLGFDPESSAFADERKLQVAGLLARGALAGR